MREDLLEAELASTTTPPIEHLERIFGDRFSKAELQAIRSEHTSADDSPALDEAGYSESLRARLAESQPLDKSQVAALGSVRAEAIREFLVDQAGIEAVRVRVRPDLVNVSATAGLIRSRLELTAGS